MHSDTFILIPGLRKYKAVDLVTGKVKKYPQPKNDSDKIHDLMILENNQKHLLYRIENRELTFFITSKCNHRCIMCPQQLDIDTVDKDLIMWRVIDNLDYDPLKPEVNPVTHEIDNPKKIENPEPYLRFATDPTYQKYFDTVKGLKRKWDSEDAYDTAFTAFTNESEVNVVAIFTGCSQRLRFRPRIIG